MNSRFAVKGNSTGWTLGGACLFTVLAASPRLATADLTIEVRGVPGAGISTWELGGGGVVIADGKSFAGDDAVAGGINSWEGIGAWSTVATTSGDVAATVTDATVTVDATGTVDATTANITTVAYGNDLGGFLGIASDHVGDIVLPDGAYVTWVGSMDLPIDVGTLTSFVSSDFAGLDVRFDVVVETQLTIDVTGVPGEGTTIWRFSGADNAVSPGSARFGGNNSVPGGAWGWNDLGSWTTVAGLTGTISATTTDAILTVDGVTADLTVVRYGNQPTINGFFAVATNHAMDLPLSNGSGVAWSGEMEMPIDVDSLSSVSGDEHGGLDLSINVTPLTELHLDMLGIPGAGTSMWRLSGGDRAVTPGSQSFAGNNTVTGGSHGWSQLGAWTTVSGLTGNIAATATDATLTVDATTANLTRVRFGNQPTINGFMGIATDHVTDVGMVDGSLVAWRGEMEVPRDISTFSDTGSNEHAGLELVITVLDMAVDVEKAAATPTVVEPGANVTFTITFLNQGRHPVELTALLDDVHGDLDGLGTCSLPQAVAGLDQYQCAFSAMVSGVDGDSETGTVTAFASADGTGLSAQDSATVSIISGVPGAVGASLFVNKDAVDPSLLDLSWGASCSSDAVDYAVYEGSVAALTAGYDHASVACSTGGSTSLEDLSAASGARFFLVVPTIPSAEGSYGADGLGGERPAAAAPCAALQHVEACP